ncbi:MAG: phosphoglycerate kinase [Candidatus Daviesbacteria bacterium]|nr:phosphoglycerate kinase [Candidatus Daviesbacteria bacterium]
MQVVSAPLVKGKKVLLRLDIDVPIEDSSVTDDFRLVAGMPTLELCLENASKVIIMGHIGRPEGKKVEELSVAPIFNWLVEHGFKDELDSGKLQLLENLRFEKGEEEASVYYAKELAALGNFYVNEAFASHHKSASTTILPMLLPRAAGLQFSKEVLFLTEAKEHPIKPLVVIIGGEKVEDKLPAALALSKIAHKVLVGGKIAKELAASKTTLPENIMLADLTEDGEDLTPETVSEWATVISSAASVLWNGPLGLVENPKNNQTERIAQLVIESGAKSIIGGGDTIAYLNYLSDLTMFSFVSTGGGAMLKFLETGKLPTIEALK